MQASSAPLRLCLEILIGVLRGGVKTGEILCLTRTSIIENKVLTRGDIYMGGFLKIVTA